MAQATAFCGHRGLARVHPPQLALRLRVVRSKGASSEGERAEAGKGVRRTDDKGKGLTRKGGCFASLRAKQPRQRSDGGRGATTMVKRERNKRVLRRKGRKAPWRGHTFALSSRSHLLAAVDQARADSVGLS